VADDYRGTGRVLERWHHCRQAQAARLGFLPWQDHARDALADGPAGWI